MDCTVVFDIPDAEYLPWQPATIGIGLTLLGGIWIIFRRTVVEISWRKYPAFMPFTFTFISALCSVMLLGGPVVKHFTYVKDQSNHQYDVISGVVSDFVPMKPGRGNQESFKVDSKVFSYSDATLTSAFHQTSINGGPIRDGEYVRVESVGDDIIRLETCPKPP